MARVFISYRQSDTGAHVGPLADALRAFNVSTVFYDREGIEIGSNYPDEIRSALAQCNVVLVLIGHAWVVAKDKHGRRRLSNPADWVRREARWYRAHIGEKMLVIPVFLDSAPALLDDDVPDDLRDLVERQGHRSNGDYKADAREIERRLVSHGRQAGKGGLLTRVRLPIGVAAFLWSGVALATAVAHPPLPGNFWIFPATMAFTAFAWKLYKDA